MYDLEENNWLKFLTGKNTILIRDEVEFKLLYDFTKEVGLPTIFALFKALVDDCTEI